MTSTVTLSTCSSDQFTCDNGLCINILNRCNLRTDCFDLSDEIDCRKIQPGDSYQTHIAPPPITGLDKVAVKVAADILTILDIEEISSVF